MENLTRLVTETLERHSVETSLDCRRLQWSAWLPCESIFSALRAPGKPGLLALAEEVGVFCAASEPRIRRSDLDRSEEGRSEEERSPANGQKRILALFQVSEVEDLGLALGRLCLPRNPDHERFASGRCFARYSVIEDAIQRRTAHGALQRWVVSASDSLEPVASGF